MRFPRILTGVVAAALLTAGCGADGSSDGSAGSEAEPAPQEKLPVPITGPHPDVLEYDDKSLTVPPKPGGSDDFTEQVERKLQEKLLQKAEVKGETSADCPDGVTQEAGATSKCTATYEGAEIPYEVTIDEDYTKGEFVTSYQSVPKRGLLTPAKVYAEFWKQKGNDPHNTRLACDEIPTATAVEMHIDTEYQCQYWAEHARSDLSEGFKFFYVSIGANGPEFANAPD